MWIINLCMLTRFDEGEVHVYHVLGVPHIFTHIGIQMGKCKKYGFPRKTIDAHIHM